MPTTLTKASSILLSFLLFRLIGKHLAASTHKSKFILAFLFHFLANKKASDLPYTQKQALTCFPFLLFWSIGKHLAYSTHKSKLILAFLFTFLANRKASGCLHSQKHNKTQDRILCPGFYSIYILINHLLIIIHLSLSAFSIFTFL